MISFLACYMCLVVSLVSAEIHSSREFNASLAAPLIRNHIGKQLVNLRTTKGLISQSNFCDFGFSDDVTYCAWKYVPISPKTGKSFVTTSHLTTPWTLTTGLNAFWIGGPNNDSTGNARGGYVVHETSSAPDVLPKMATMNSLGLLPTGATGRCLKFWYAKSGLSANILRVRVQITEDRFNSFVIWESTEDTQGGWKEAQVLYTFSSNHTVIVEGLPFPQNHPLSIFRGYMALDDIALRPGEECIGMCSFEGGLCDWSNTINDDFDWALDRGTQNPVTGPPRDYGSSSHEHSGGAFVVADSGFPRRSGDVAQLESIDFQSTDPYNPPCMSFYFYMSGSGVGALRVILQNADTGFKKVVWALQGHQGARWSKGQLPLSSNTPFRILFEGSIGVPQLGDIALDNINIYSGPCSTTPMRASPPSSGDCTFEEGLCNWVNPSLRLRFDDLDFIRVSASKYVYPNQDHTNARHDGYFMALENGEGKLEGDRAWLISPPIKGTRSPKCVSFWYMMFEALVDSSTPNLGSLSAFLKKEDSFGSIILSPIWSIHNFQGLNWNLAQAPLKASGEFQIVIEAIWGSASTKGLIAVDDISVFEGSCPTLPESAVVRPGDCTFTRGLCGWQNVSSPNGIHVKMASPIHRPFSISDTTYGARAGYIYFDVFHKNFRRQSTQLVSPTIQPSLDGSPMCFAFRFNGFGADRNTTLDIYLRTTNSQLNFIDLPLNDVKIWSNKPVGAYSEVWQFGQVSLLSSSQFYIIIEGSSLNGGIAFDDFKIYPGGCAKRPK